MSRDINLLKPYVAYLCNKLIEECKKQGLTIQVIETLRTQARQTEIHKAGNGPALIGPHGYGLAFDAVPLKNGKIDWKDYTLFKKMGAIGKSLGLEWGGDWKSVDCPHFQYVKGLTDTQIRNGKLPNFPPIPGETPPLDKQYRVYVSKLLGNGLTETYAKTKAQQLKSQGYEVYYITPDGKKVNV